MDNEHPSSAHPTPPATDPGPVGPTPPPRRRGPRSAPPGVPYHRVLATEKRQFWRGVAALLLLLAGLFAFSLGFGALGLFAESALGLTDPTSDDIEITPVSQATALFSLALLLPWSMLVQRWVYKVEGVSLHSVRSFFRFDLMARALLVVLPVWTVYMVALNMFLPYGEGHWSSFDLFATFAIVIVLTPLQSAGEEYGFRGLAFRVAASWGRGPRTALFLGVVVSSLLFMVVHLALDPWLNLYYFSLGATLALLTWRTGGLELAVVVHAVNNTVAFLLVLITRTDLAEGMDRSVGTGSPVLLLPCVLLLVFTAVVWRRDRRSGPPLTTGPPPA
ncbi:CPBP family intramembrane glutamic endopeptidase [Nocardiopsis kunsanensis]|uniref:CPBP family intramembrane glutamic endopeptidase n=1 Tax=Nocardiopsis kunsanensis TaxID=141693 RepID=UPI0018740BDF